MKNKNKNPKTKWYIAAAAAVVVVGGLAIAFSSGTLFQGLFPPFPTIPTVTCAPDKASAYLGENVTWSVKTTGFDPATKKTYSWDGSGPMQNGATTPTVPIVYDDSSHVGDMTAKVIVTDPNNNASATSGWCSVKIENPPPITELSCYPTVNTKRVHTAEIGEVVTWVADITGGVSPFEYLWGGRFADDDNPLNKPLDESTFVNTYYNTGSPSVPGKISISDGVGQAKLGVACDQLTIVAPPLQLSCSGLPANPKIGDTVKWTSTLTGGDPNYPVQVTYSWTGTDGFSSNWPNDEKPYTTAGTKTATITYNVGSEILSKTCSVEVQPAATTHTLSCSANPSNPKVGDTVTWYPNFTGGGTPSYTWSGANITNKNVTNPTSTFTQVGNYTASLTGIYGGSTYSATCPVTVSAKTAVNNPSISTLAISNVPYNPEKGSTTLSWYLNDYKSKTSQTVEIYKYPYTSSSKAVKTWKFDTTAGGKQSVTWDGKNIFNELVTDGEYFLDVRGEEISSGYDLSPAQLKFDVKRGTTPTPTPTPTGLCAGMKDVLATDSRCKKIEWGKEEGIFDGNADGTFGQFDSLQRDQAAKVILEAFDKYDSSIDYCKSVRTLGDMTRQFWSWDYVCAGQYYGVITGYESGADAGYFRPERFVNRAEFLALVLRNVNDTMPFNNVYSYDDVDAGAWYSGYAFYSMKKGLFPGSYLNPTSYVTRGEVIDVLYKLHELKQL